MFNPMDNINSFILEYRKGLSNFDITEYKRNMKYVTEGVVMPVIGFMNPDIYVNYINKSIEDMKGIAPIASSLNDFYSRVYNSVSLKDKNITIPLQSSSDISKIRPEYFTNVTIDFDLLTKDIISGKAKYKDVKKQLILSDYSDKMKKQLVKTTLVVNDPRDLMSLDSPSLVKIDNEFIQTVIIPFTRNYQSDVNGLIELAANTKARMHSNYESLTATIDGINSMIESDKFSEDTAKLLTIASYNVIRHYMNLCAYVSGMLIRKMSYYTYNMMSFVTLKNTILNYFPEGEKVLHESVLDGDLDDIDDSILLNSVLTNNLNVVIPHIQNAIGLAKMEIANLVSKKYNLKINFNMDIDAGKYGYDVFPYQASKKALEDIMNALTTFDTLSKDPEMVVDDIISRSGLEETFLSKYTNILTNIEKIDHLNAQMHGIRESDYFLTIYNELNHYESNIESVCRDVTKCYDKLEAIKDNFDINNNQLNDNTYNELKSFVETLIKNFKDFALMLAKKFLSRLDTITDALETTDIDDSEYSEPEEFTPYDYSLECAMEAYNEIENDEKVIFESLMRDYNVFRNKKDRGVKIVYEETTTTQNADNANVDVKTDANSQHADNENKTTTANTTNADKQNQTSMIDKFKDFINKIVEQFKAKAAKLFNKNNPWLKSVKAKIENLDYSNTSITLAKYEGVTTDKILADITGAINKINSIKATSLPNELKGSNTKAEQYLFSSIPGKVGNETNFVGRIKQFFTHGNVAGNTLVTYSGNDAKTKVDNMISFCEGYGRMYSEVSSNLDKLKDAAANKQREIINSLGSATTESVMLEANQNDVKVNGASSTNSQDTKDKVRTSNVITSVVRDYSGAILTVIEKKYLDYIKVLDKLAPKQPDNKAAKNESEADNNNG